MIGYGYFLLLARHYKSYIPESFEIKKSVFAGDRIGGFIEGCGVAVFELTENTSKKISSGGVLFLNSNSTTRDSVHSQYSSWKETPLTEPRSFHLFNGVANEDAGGKTCVEVPGSLKQDISSAIRSSGAFYSSFNKNTELLVIPKLHLAVYSHDR